MINIKLEESSSLKIDMEIEGSVHGKTDMRLSVLNEGLRYSFNAKHMGGTGWEIEFPKMIGKINEGTYDAEIEIIVDGKHFVPLTETVNFTKEIKPTVKLAEAAPKPATAGVKVKLGEVAKKPEKVLVENVKSLIHAAKVDNEVNTALALFGLNALVEGRAQTNEYIRIAPAAISSEAELLAVLKLIESRGDDLTTIPTCEALAGHSVKVREALINVLKDKGISTKNIIAAGI